MTALRQASPLDVGIGKRTGNPNARPVLRQARIADRGESKNLLDDQRWMLDFRRHARFAGVLPSLLR